MIAYCDIIIGLIYIYIDTIHADGEFRPLFEKVRDRWDIDFNFALPDEHLPDIERMNRLLQERFWVNLYCLPFKIIPCVVIRALVMRCVRHRGFFVPKGGISKYYLPDTIVSGRVIDFNKELKYSFGD